ncbi:hypothetical protein Pint_33731 [Pistacia integerrima]|uniref:Uncharacterized protein n=1 Tax=Pistacia integerrima TaxID=434235 RepID=A0ACC0X424_9ROSI|nr:hypothetical protein Pint_33731 [Pistacia integerrima]
MMFSRDHEVRCVKRKLLFEALETELPSGTIRYSSKVVSIKESGCFKLVHLADGTIIKTKVIVQDTPIDKIVATPLRYDSHGKSEGNISKGGVCVVEMPSITEDRKIGAFDAAGDGREAVEAAEVVEEGGLKGKCEGGGDLCYPQEHVAGEREAATATDRRANEEMPNLRSKIEEMEREKAESKRRVEELEEMIGFMSRRRGCEFEEQEDQFGGCGL